MLALGAAADGASPARPPPLTSRCAARFLTGHGSVPVHTPGLGECLVYNMQHLDPGTVTKYKSFLPSFISFLLVSSDDYV